MSLWTALLLFSDHNSSLLPEHQRYHATFQDTKVVLSKTTSLVPANPFLPNATISKVLLEFSCVKQVILCTGPKGPNKYVGVFFKIDLLTD